MPPSGTGYNNSFAASYVDIDGDASTFSSSSDSLALPSCSEISWAGLYWGGEMNSTGANYATRNQCRIKVNGGSYQGLTADYLQDNATGYDSYHCFKNVTDLVQAGGLNARITVANVAARVGGTNRFGGWTLVVVYKNASLPMRTLNVFNGLSNISGSSAATEIPLNGFLTPPSGPVTFEVGIVGYDGDRSLTGDQLLFNGAGTFVNISDAINPTSDVFNSTASYNGVLTPYRNPSYNNLLGYDADIFVPNNATFSYLPNNVNNATLRLTTGGETFLSQVVTVAIDVYEPEIKSTVAVSDLNGGSLQPGDTLLYTVTGRNTGSDVSLASYVTDTLEGNVNYVAGSLRIVAGFNTGTKTDLAGDDQAEYLGTARTVRVRIGSGANAANGGTLNNSPGGTDSSTFTFRATVSTDCLQLLCDPAADNQAVMRGTGQFSGNVLTVLSSPSAVNAAGCPLYGKTTLPIASSCSSPSAASNSPLCNGDVLALSASSYPSAAYSWAGPNGFSANTASPTISNVTAAMSGNYTLTISLPGTGCSYAFSVPVSIGQATATGEIAGSAASESHAAGTANSYFRDASCNRISRVQPAGASPVAGTVTAKVWIESGVPTFAGQPYVARHYEITPASNSATATGRITLYFLQSEFTSFNNAPGSTLDLPAVPIDAGGIANLRIGRTLGTSSNNTGLPGTYSGARTIIDPADGDIVWNGTAQRWEVTFDATGFGGFFVQTFPVPLPVSLVEFTAEKAPGAVLLHWLMANEEGISSYTPEHSTDGLQFSGLETLSARNSGGQSAYRSTHLQPGAGIHYYRVAMAEAGGPVHYSPIRKVYVEGTGDGLILLSNPVQDRLLRFCTERAGQCSVSDGLGRTLLRSAVAEGVQELDVQQLAPGSYYLRMGGESRQFVIE